MDGMHWWFERFPSRLRRRHGTVSIAYCQYYTEMHWIEKFDFDCAYVCFFVSVSEYVYVWVRWRARACVCKTADNIFSGTSCHQHSYLIDIHTIKQLNRRAQLVKSNVIQFYEQCAIVCILLCRCCYRWCCCWWFVRCWTLIFRLMISYFKATSFSPEFFHNFAFPFNIPLKRFLAVRCKWTIPFIHSFFSHSFYFDFDVCLIPVHLCSCSSWYL